MKKRILLTLLLVCLLVSASAPVAQATEPNEGEVQANSCGENLTWELDGNTLTVSGKGKMDDFNDGAPWAAHKDDITMVVLEGVTYIGACAFENYDSLNWVDFGDALTEIGPQAFRSCDNLTEITLPASFKIFGKSCFENCKNLSEIHCNGKTPTFKLNALWQTYVTITYPAKNNWSVTYIAEMEEAFHGRVEFVMDDGTDPYEPTEPEETTESTEPEATTESTEPEETTEPVETTEPTEVTEPAEETEATEAETEPVEETIPETEEVFNPDGMLIAPNPNAPTDDDTEPTEEVRPREFGSFGGKIGLVIVAVILCVLALGAILFRPRKKGKYSRRRKKKNSRRR